jgi:hypothetical protein
MLKKLGIGAGSLFGLLLLIGIASPAPQDASKTSSQVNNPATLGAQTKASVQLSPSLSPSSTPTPYPSLTPTPRTTFPTGTPIPTVAATPQPTPASTYTNVDGNKIESPNSNPLGATGVCRDGTYTHATHHQGACSYHGGVAYWY